MIDRTMECPEFNMASPAIQVWDPAKPTDVCRVVSMLLPFDLKRDNQKKGENEFCNRMHIDVYYVVSGSGQRGERWRWIKGIRWQVMKVHDEEWMNGYFPIGGISQFLLEIWSTTRRLLWLLAKKLIIVWNELIIANQQCTANWANMQNKRFTYSFKVNY